MRHLFNTTAYLHRLRQHQLETHAGYPSEQQYFLALSTYSPEAIEYSDEAIEYSDEAIEHSTGAIEYSNGVIEYSNGVIEYPDGTMKYPNGTIKYADGSTTCSYQAFKYLKKILRDEFKHKTHTKIKNQFEMVEVAIPRSSR